MFRITSCLAWVLALICAPVYAGQRAFVSSSGNDANLAAGCTLAAPCRTFQAAHTAVDAGGEIVALNTAGYAPVTITKSVSIVGSPGFVAGIAVASGNGVTIATAGISVVLRNLNINGIGGANGVHMTAGDSLTIENCVISRMASDGIRVDTAADVRIVGTLVRANPGDGVQLAGNASADIIDSEIIGNGFGVLVLGNLAGTVRAAVSDTVLSGNTVGLATSASVAGATANVSVIRSTIANNASIGIQNQATAGVARTRVGSSMVTGNGTGFNNGAAGGTATFESQSNNIVRQNGTDTSGVITAAAGA